MNWGSVIRQPWSEARFSAISAGSCSRNSVGWSNGVLECWQFFGATFHFSPFTFELSVAVFVNSEQFSEPAQGQFAA